MNTKEEVKLEALENDFDMEISNSLKNPHSLFEDALPSLKLKQDDRLTSEQMKQVEDKRFQLSHELMKQRSIGSGHKAELQGQGSPDDILFDQPRILDEERPE